jgi:hypothetical protein
MLYGVCGWQNYHRADYESGNDFKAIRELSPEEAAQLRVALGLTPFHA